MASMKFHSLPSDSSSPVLGSRDGVHSGASRARGGDLASRDLTICKMPSSSKRVQAFFNVSLLTASK